MISANVLQEGAAALSWPVIDIELQDERSALSAVFEVLHPVGIGNLDSAARGSAARFNGGKPPLELVPFRAIAASFRSAFESEAQLSVVAALDALGRWQARDGNDQDNLADVLRHLGQPWVDCALVFDFGRGKYAPWNWAKGMPWSAALASAGRHLLAMLGGEELDPESGLPHRGHVACNIVMLLTFAETFVEGDDRPAAGLLA